jgi:hypothetical protein
MEINKKRARQPPKRDMVTDLGFRGAGDGGAGDGNRTRTISLGSLIPCSRSTCWDGVFAARAAGLATAELDLIALSVSRASLVKDIAHY